MSLPLPEQEAAQWRTKPATAMHNPASITQNGRFQYWKRPFYIQIQRASLGAKNSHANVDTSAAIVERDEGLAAAKPVAHANIDDQAANRRILFFLSISFATTALIQLFQPGGEACRRELPDLGIDQG